jgi:hypothetical protein
VAVTETLMIKGKTAAQALAESPIAGLLEQARRLGRISSLVADFCRDAAADNRPATPRCVIEGKQVVILVASPSQAAKLRQRATTLCRLLQDCDPDLTGIRIRLQPGRADDPCRGSANPPAAEPRPQISADEALNFAEELGRSLDDSPLRHAVFRLQGVLRKKLRRGG